MQLASRDIDPVAHAKRLLLDLTLVDSRIILWIRDGETATTNEMCCHPAVRVWRVVRIAIDRFSLSIGWKQPSEPAGRRIVRKSSVVSTSVHTSDLSR